MKRVLLNTFKYPLLIIMVLIAISSCNSTKYLKPNETLLKKNTINLFEANDIKNKGEIKDNLYKLEAQKPNTYSWLLQSPRKLLYYNFRYKKFRNLPDSLLPKAAERPVIFDSSLIAKTTQNMKNYLSNLGYFYAKTKDTFYTKKQKTYITHKIYLGKNYKINNIYYDITDTGIYNILMDTKDESNIQTDKAYSVSLIDDERSRIVSTIRNNGYFHFTQENIQTFQLDTFNKGNLKVKNNIFGGIKFETTKNTYKNPKTNIKVEIRLADDSTAFNKYTINSVSVYPDFKNYDDLTDTSLIKKTIDSVDLFYHDYYVNAKILTDHIFIVPKKLYSQEDYDMTFAKLNELGIFQYIRIAFTESPDKENALDCTIYMNKSKKYDFSQNDELSSGSTYDLGISAGVNFHNKNFQKGANLFTLSLNGGLEYAYNATHGKTVFDHFQVLTEYFGLNASIDFPKFISPIGNSYFDDYNLPHTIISGGSNLIERLNYFRLINTSFNYNYTWHKSKTITWSFAPIFFNVISMPYETDSFKSHLEQFPFLKNSYKPNFIEGENLSFTYSDVDKKHNKNYSYLRLSIEEAGWLLGYINQLGSELNNLYNIKNAQYTKFDFDARHFFTYSHATLAVRFWGGLGYPYGQSNTLPYIKQYFVGGPYSLRGWQIRSMGPGTYYDTSANANSLIDRTGDIKLELNTELRFPIAPLFAGAIKMNGALFADAGNIWLAKRDSTFPGGEIAMNTLGKCIAVDIGAGLRFDIATFLTFRIDLAMPVKKPYITNNEGWVFDQVDLMNSNWRANNLIVNIAIGYPF